MKIEKANLVILFWFLV